MVALYNDTKKVILLIGTSVRTSCPKLSFLAASFALPYPTNPLPTHSVVKQPAYRISTDWHPTDLTLL